MTGKKLKKLRIEYGLTQLKLAEEIGIKAAQISAYEAEKRPIPQYTAKAIDRLIAFEPRFVANRAKRLLAADPEDQRVIKAYQRAANTNSSPIDELCWLLYQEAGGFASVARAE